MTDTVPTPVPSFCDALPSGFTDLLHDVKTRIRNAQTRAILAVNAELVRLYWDIGRLIDERQQHEGWGAAVIPRLASELHNELPDVKGFSERNIGRMIAFSRAYPTPAKILPQPVAKIGDARIDISGPNDGKTVTEENLVKESCQKESREEKVETQQTSPQLIERDYYFPSMPGLWNVSGPWRTLNIDDGPRVHSPNRVPVVPRIGAPCR